MDTRPSFTDTSRTGPSRGAKGVSTFTPPRCRPTRTSPEFSSSGRRAPERARSRSPWPSPAGRSSDDHVLAWRDEGQLRLSGLRVPLFLSPDAAARLPAHLPKGQPVPAMGKLMFQPDDLFPGQYRNMGRLGAILFPERAPVAESKPEDQAVLSSVSRRSRKYPTSVTRPIACMVPRLPSFTGTDSVMSTQTVRTATGRRFPTAMA